MGNTRTMLLIIVIAAAFGALMSYGTGMPSVWQRALFAALAFAGLGLLLSYVRAGAK